MDLSRPVTARLMNRPHSWLPAAAGMTDGGNHPEPHA